MPSIAVSVSPSAFRHSASAPPAPDAIFDTALKLWLPVNDTSVTEAGTGASQWDDQSGNGHSLVQATDGNRPTYAATDTDFNGQGSLSFNGTSDRLIDASASIDTGGSYTWWAVIKPATADANPRWLMESGTGRLGLVWTWTGTKTGIFTSSFTAWSSSSPSASAKALIVEFTAGSPGTARLYEGGVDRGTISYTSTNLAGAFAVGSNFSGTSSYFSGKIATVGIASGVDANSTTLLRESLGYTFGVAA